MSTAVAEPKRPEPKAKRHFLATDPVVFYRHKILSGQVPSEEETLAACCFLGDRETDAATLASRKRAARDLVDASRVLEKVADAERKLATVDPRAVPVANFLMIGDLVDAIEAYQHVRDNPCEPSPAKLAIHDATMQAKSIRQSAIELLWKSASAESHTDAKRLAGMIAEERKALAARPNLDQLQANLQQADAKIEGLLRGARTTRKRKGFVGGEPVTVDPRSVLAEARADREAVLVKISEAKSAEKQTRATEKELARLENEQQILASRMKDPENMRWASDPPAGPRSMNL